MKLNTDPDGKSTTNTSNLYYIEYPDYYQCLQTIF